MNIKNKLRNLRRKSVILIKSLTSVFGTRFWGAKALISVGAAIMAYWLAAVLIGMGNPVILGITIFYFVIMSYLLNLENYHRRNFRQKRFFQISRTVFGVCALHIVISIMAILVDIPLLLFGETTAAKAFILLVSMIALGLASYMFIGNIGVSVDNYTREQTAPIPMTPPIKA
jgi:hypothetical protein